MGSLTIISGIASPESNNRISFLSSSDNDSFSVMLNVSLVVRETVNNRSYLAIGRRSEFMHHVGSIAIIKRNEGSEMILGSSLENFRESCVSDSFLDIVPTGVFIQGSFGLSNGTHIESIEDRQFFISQTQGYLGSVPTVIFDRIENAILENDTIGRIFNAGDDRVMFSNCSGEILQHLPSIRISLTAQTGSFVLHPDDYMYFIESRNECWLRLIHNDLPSHLWVDVLLIGGANVRMSSDQSLQICDSIGKS